MAEGSNKDYDRTNDFYRGLGFKKLEIFLSYGIRKILVDFD